MKRTIFYSWQSDLNSRGNRNLIEDALKRSLKAIKRDKIATIEPVLDRDTAGVPGAPSISHSIFDKISLADVFIADISIINNKSDTRFTPNPNVLTELGYAVAELGWGNIILVQNIYYGTPDDLPFDLRGRRVVTYSFDIDKDNKSEIRGILQGKFEMALKSVLNDSTLISLPSGKNAPIWWGKWKMPDAELGFGGNLFIREVGTSGFLFDLNVFNGSHTGEITAYARFVSPNLAYARVSNETDEEIGELAFRRSIDANSISINIEETASCSSYRGLGASFHGTFIHRSEYLFEIGLLNELDLQRLFYITGEFYDSLRECMQMISNHHENLDTFVADVVSGGVRGLFTIMEGIVMRGEYGQLWAAFIDGDFIRYFSSQSKWKECLPKTIDNWRERFKDKEILYHKYVETMPGNSYE